MPMSPPIKGESPKPVLKRSPNPFAELLRRQLRWLLVGALVCGAIGGASYFVWRSVARQVLDDEQYKLSLDGLTITPQPTWIRADLRKEIYREGGFEQRVSLHEENLAERIAKTFALHPWVAKVERVSLRGASVDVALVYRKPVCMVEVPGGVFPVDLEGVLLPRDDFTPAEARRYPRLSGVTTVPAGLVGMPWGDLHVVGGAEIADALAGCWQELNLDHIAVVAGGSRDITFELAARPGTVHAGDRIVWGHAPGTSNTGEPRVEQKIATLKQFLGEPAAGTPTSHGPLQLDLRRPAQRTAMNPGSR
jgi:hypothetical protein